MWLAVRVRDMPTPATGAAAWALLCDESTLLPRTLLTGRAEGRELAADALSCVQCVVDKATILEGGAGLDVTGLLPPDTLSAESTLFCMRLVLPMGGRLAIEREATFGRELM
jgi:hypothetical protein